LAKNLPVTYNLKIRTQGEGKSTGHLVGKGKASGGEGKEAPKVHERTGDLDSKGKKLRLQLKFLSTFSEGLGKAR